MGAVVEAGLQVLAPIPSFVVAGLLIALAIRLLIRAAGNPAGQGFAALLGAQAAFHVSIALWGIPAVRSAGALLVPAFALILPFAVAAAAVAFRRAFGPTTWPRWLPAALLLTGAGLVALYAVMPTLVGPPVEGDRAGALVALIAMAPLAYALASAELARCSLGAPSAATRPLVVGAAAFALPSVFVGALMVAEGFPGVETFADPMFARILRGAALVPALASGALLLRLRSRTKDGPVRRLALAGATAIGLAAASALVAAMARLGSPMVGSAIASLLEVLWSLAFFGLVAHAIMTPGWRRVAWTQRFRIQRELGHGASGRASVAYDTRLDRVVVLKQALTDWPDEATRRRFEHEANAMAKIRHPNVVALLDVLVDERPPALVMEYVDGLNLRDRLRRSRKLSLQEVERIFLGALNGLEEIHRAGIIHRDLKPANILLDKKGQAKISDFGVARAPAESTATVTMAATTFQPGSPAYMSPEQARGETLDRRSDLYSLGTVLHEALAGRHYINAKGRSEFQIRELIQEADPSMAARGLPQPLARVVVRCLARSPADRYQSAVEMAAALRAALAEAKATGPRRGPR